MQPLCAIEPLASRRRIFAFEAALNELRGGAKELRGGAKELRGGDFTLFLH